MKLFAFLLFALLAHTASAACFFHFLFGGSIFCDDRRRLDEDGLTFFDVPDNCLHQPYSLSVFMSVHIVLAAVPVEDNEECPAVGMHAHFGPDMAPEKNWFLLTEEQLEQLHIEGQSLNNEEYPLGQIEDAFLSAEVSDDSEEFDMVINNCSHFILSLVNFLGVNMLPAEVVQYATSQLMENMDDLLPLLEASPNMHLISGRRTLTQNEYEQYIQQLVENLVHLDIELMGMGIVQL